MKEEAGGGLTVKTCRGSGVFPRTSLTVLRPRRLRQWGSTRKKSVPTGFRWRDMPIHRFQFSDCSRRSKQPEQKITLNSPEKSKEKLSRVFFFSRRPSCATSTGRGNTLLYEHCLLILQFFFFFTSCLGTHSATARKIQPYNGHFAVYLLTESLKPFLCADYVTQKFAIKGKVTLGNCGLRLEWMGQWSRGWVDEIVSALV